jgi:hypothetical protein
LPDELVHRHRSANGTINAPIKMPGTLFVVATPIGNLEDITLRALRVLREVSVIAAEDTRRTAHLLARHAISTPTTSLHEHNETRKTPSVIARLMSGENVALVSDAGTPTVSDPGGHLIREAIAAGGNGGSCRFGNAHRELHLSRFSTDSVESQNSMVRAAESSRRNGHLVRSASSDSSNARGFEASCW